MQFGPVRFELRFVGHGANQWMVKHILRLAGEANLIDELTSQQIIDDGVDSQRGQQVEGETRAEHRRRTQRSLGLCVEAVDARGDSRLQRNRHIHVSDVRRGMVCARPAAQHTPLGQIADHLLGEERIPGGALGDLLPHCAL